MVLFVCYHVYLIEDDILGYNLLQDTGLYYDRYLREVIEVLETDPHFREKLQTANTEDIKVIIRLLSVTHFKA